MEDIKTEQTTEIVDQVSDAQVEQQESQERVYSQEEVDAMMKKMQSDTDKGVQKLLKEKKTYELTLEEVSKVAENKEHLIDLYSTNSEVAKIILNKYFDGMSIEEYATEYDIEVSNPKLIEAKVRKQLEKELESSKIAQSVEDFAKELQMTEDEKQAFIEAFEERKSLKSFNSNDIRRHMEKAYREVNDEYNPTKDKVTQKIAQSHATGAGSSVSAKETKSDFDKTREDVRDFLKNFNY